MARRTVNHIKLGVFVIAGLSFLILVLYMIGKNQNLFGNTFILKARFDNAQGLMYGNNIRFAGIDAGTVKEVKVINDTTIEVTMLIKTRMKPYIRKNAVASITTDGIMGNRIVNINPTGEPGAFVEAGDMLKTRKGPDTEEMLRVLDKTNRDLSVIASSLKQTTSRLNESNGLWKLLEDENIPENLRSSLKNFSQTGENLDRMSNELGMIISDVKNGKGTAGILLRDTSMAMDIKASIKEIRSISISADSLARSLNLLADSLNYNLNKGEGVVTGLLKDKKMKNDLDRTLENIEEGTRAFNENMEALKHNWLFRGYFKKQEKKASQ